MKLNHASRLLFAAAIATTAACDAGCKHPAESSSLSVVANAPPPGVVTIAEAPPAAPALVDYQDKGTHFQYPNSWKPTPDKDYELHLIPSGGPGNRDITFDIPDLPPHFPGMIRLGLIENGYVGDLKKQHPDLHVDSSADHALTDGAAKARLVESSWTKDGVKHSDVGLLIMRKDVVYILSCDADAKDLASTRADFDRIVASLRWDK